jgi:2-dehydrotetronate isomerase
LQLTPLLSANLGFLWKELPLLEAIEAAANAGFGAIELHFPYATPALEVKTACARHNLRLISINTDISSGPDAHFGLGAVPGREKEFRQLAEQGFAYAEAAGAPFVHIMAGLVASHNLAEAQAVFVENLDWASKRARQFGLTLLLEPLNNKDVPGYFYAKFAQATRIIDLVGADNIKLTFDAYHVGMMEGEIITPLENCFEYIGHIQIASVPGRAEPDGGNMDFSQVFTALESLGYNGWIGCEYTPRTSVEAGLGWVEKLGCSPKSSRL